MDWTEKLERLARTAANAIARADKYRRQLDDANRTIEAQRARIEELSHLLGEKQQGPGEVRA
jgi:chromosome segregation ATPase